jgi:Putative ATP-binding cassette
MDVLDDVIALGRLRLRLMSRLLLGRFTDESKRAAPFRLAAAVTASTVALLLVSWVLGILFVKSLQGQPAGPFFLPAITWAASAAAVGIFFYAGLTLSAALTQRNDLTMLLLAPLSPGVVLADRLLAVSGSFSVLLTVVGLPNLVGAGHALAAGPAYYLTCAAAVLLIPLTPASAGLLLVVLVLRQVPPRRARVATAIASAVAAGILYLVTDAHGGWTVVLPSGTWQAFPTDWPGEALVAAGRGDLQSAYVYLVGATCFAALLGWVAVKAASRLLASGWATYMEVGHSHGTTTTAPGITFLARAPTSLSDRTPWRALMRKEWLSIRRDPKLIAQLSYPLLLEGFTLYKAIGNPFTAHPVTGRLGRLLAGSLYLSGSLTALFLLTILALPMVSREGRSLYVLAVSPVRARAVVLSKVAFCVVPVLGILEVVLITIGARLLSLSAQQTLFDALVFAALMIALAGWLVCVGIVWPRLSADSSRRQIHGTALLVGPTTGVVLCGFVGWLLIAVYAGPHGKPWLAPAAGASIFAITGLIIAGVVFAGPRLLEELLSGDRRAA